MGLTALRAPAPRTSEQPMRQARALAIFDFDCTLTTIHMWSRYKNAALEDIPVDEATFVDLGAFRDFVARARREDADVAIATFGRRDVVDKALRFALGDKHDVVISTPADHYDPRFELSDDVDRPRCREGDGILGDKNTQISSLCTIYGLPKDAVFLADDDPENVSAAQKYGVKAQHTPHGANKRILDALFLDLLALANHHAPRQSPTDSATSD